jgi:hypothetical protein
MTREAIQDFRRGLVFPCLCWHMGRRAFSPCSYLRVSLTKDPQPTTHRDGNPSRGYLDSHSSKCKGA